MKLAKKILACALALALSVCLGVVAFAADDAKVNVAAKFAEDGTVTLALTAVGAKNTVLAQLKFDTDKFEYVGYNCEGDAEGGLAVDDSSVLSTTAMSMKEFKGDVDLGVFTLKAKDGVDVADFTFTEDSNIDETTSISGTISAKRDVPTTPAPTTAAPTKGDDSNKTTKGGDDTGKKTTTGKGTSIPKNGDAGIAVVAGISALAAVAFVVTKKK